MDNWFSLIFVFRNTFIYLRRKRTIFEKTLWNWRIHRGEVLFCVIVVVFLWVKNNFFLPTYIFIKLTLIHSFSRTFLRVLFNTICRLRFVLILFIVLCLFSIENTFDQAINNNFQPSSFILVYFSHFFHLWSILWH